MAGSKISLCYDTDATFNGNEHWIEIDGVAAANGSGTFSWNTANVPAGNYYLAGYMYDGSKATFSHLGQAITITGPAAQTFAVTGPISGSYQVGQSVTIAMDGRQRCCRQQDQPLLRHRYHLSTATNIGSKSTAWRRPTAAARIPGIRPAWRRARTMSPATYGTAARPHISHLAQAITIASASQSIAVAKQTFAVTGPTSGTYKAGQAVNVSWTAGNVAAGNTISLCYDTDTTFNGNEHWIEIDRVTAANGSGAYTWNTAGVAPGTYYLAGYLWNGTTPTFSHLATAITDYEHGSADVRDHRTDLRRISGRPDDRHSVDGQRCCGRQHD